MMKVVATGKHPHVSEGVVIEATAKDAEMLVTRGYAVYSKQEVKPKKTKE